MAKELFFSSQVCEQLARELVTEQAEMLKHEALVKEIKAKLIEGKQQLIRKLILGKTFRLEGKKMTALEILFDEKDGKLQVHIEFGLDPESEVTPCLLTKNEKQLLKEYRNCLEACCYGLEYMSNDTLEIARRLGCLKNSIILTRCYCWEIDINNTTTPGFFSKSGLTTGRFIGVGTKPEMLEDVRFF
jgi:hypothetical protein